MNSAEELGSVDMIVHRMTTSSILSPESLVAGRGGSNAPGSAELGRRLLLAARHGDTQLVLDLMGRGAPFTTDWLGTSALHVAAGGAHTATCAVLLRAGVSRDARSKVDRTPLHMAAHAGHTEVAELLLLNHAAVDCRDMLYMTPLHWAAERGHMQIAGVLLKHGADPFAVSKFNKTPHSIAMERKRHDILKLIEDTLKEREAAKSVESLRVANETEANETQRSLDSLDRLAEAAKQTNKQTPPTEPININIERPLETSTEDASAAAAMLRRHGITLLPQDEGSTVLTALQSGRSVVLSDAGKLMLKESSEVPQFVKSPASKGVVLTATPVKSPPRQGVKIFTLNNKLLTMPKENKAPIKKVINPRDSMQLQYIKLPSDAKITTTKPVPMKAKNKLATARPPVQVLPAGATGTVVPAGGSMRPTVKLMMQKANLNKLTENGVESAGRGRGRDERNVLFVPEEFLTNSSPKYLRAQLLSAHTTIAALSNQLETCRARLAHYEDV